MLAQVYRVTNSAASGVVREYATLGTLFKEYEREDQLRKRELLLNNCVVGYVWLNHIVLLILY